nr:LCP family protein [Gordonia sp. NB41Y]EMP13246.2 transcriptional regulator [Gordonia sp. NB41Y]
MSRWTPKPRRRGSGDDAGDDARAARREHSRGGSDDSSRYAAPPTGEMPAADRLREPRSADRFVRGRTRLTVRELMEQMNAAEPEAGTAPSAPDESPTQAIPTTRGRRNRPPRPQTPSVPPDLPRYPSRPPVSQTPPAPIPDHRSPAPRHVDDPSRQFGTGIPVGNDVTQKIPPVDAGAEPGVDLSDRATTRRAIEESRAQGSHVAPPGAAVPNGPGAQPPTSTGGADTAGADDVPTGFVPVPPDIPRADTSRADAPTDAPSADTSAAAGTPTVGEPEPLQRTPDLTEIARGRPRRVAGRSADRSLARSATVTGRILVSVACVLALVGTGFVWGFLKSTNGNWHTIMAVDPDDTNIRNKDAQYGDENYLIVGTDTRAGNNSKVGAGTTADADGARSDTVILVNIPADRSRVVAVSFPRDLQVDRPECQQWDNANGTYGETLPAETHVKLNSVYALGGPQCLVRVITQMSGLNINHFIAMDFYGFEKVVNAVGGVEVCSTAPMYDYELGTILKKPGTQKLTGRRALNYVRARTVSTEGNGDYGRIKRQQLFMSSLLRATLSGNVLSNPAKLNSIIKTFIEYSYVDNVDTNSLIQLAESMQGIDAGRVTFLTIPTSGTSTDGENNEIPRTDDVDAIFNAIIDDQPLPGEQKRKTSTTSSAGPSSPTVTATTPSRASATAQNPGNVGVRVLNGTGRTGAASEVSDQLSAQGFDVRGVADASENRTDTVIRYGVGELDSAATLAEMFPGANVQLDRTVRSGVEVILGSDFDGSVGSAPSVGTTLSVEQLPQASNSGSLPNDLAVTNAGDTTCS